MSGIRLLGVLLGCGLLAACGADVTAQARRTASRDLSCSEADTKIVDQQYTGLYRVQGCGIEATYRCEEDRLTLAMRCRQVASYKIPEQPDPDKPAPASDLAKSAR